MNRPLPAGRFAGAVVLHYTAPSTARRAAPMDAETTESQRLAALLAAASGGDERAFADLYAAVSARLFGTVRRFLSRRDEAEDCLQEAFVLIWRHAATYAPERGAPLTWMIRIARNAAIDRLRRRRRSLPEDRRDADSPAAEPAGDLAEEMLAADTGAHLAAALADLPAVQREAVTMAFYLGYTHEELAARMDLPLGTVKSHIRRGLERLKERVAP